MGMIKRTFTYMDKTMLVQLYKVFVRPHLEYCQQACSPYLMKGQTKLEQVQRRATKLVKSLEELPYEQRLKELNLYSLQDRRTRGDLILMYRIMTKDIGITSTDIFKLKTSVTRGHSLAVQYRKINTLDIRQNFFTERVIKPWNNLPQEIVSSPNIKMFKKSYDKWRGLVV